MFENLHGFHSYKFHNDKLKNGYSFQECSITWSTKILLIFKNSITIACYLITSQDAEQLKTLKIRSFQENNLNAWN